MSQICLQPGVPQLQHPTMQDALSQVLQILVLSSFQQICFSSPQRSEESRAEVDCKLLAVKRCAQRQGWLNVDILAYSQLLHTLLLDMMA